jgi:hypothetical protein
MTATFLRQFKCEFVIDSGGMIPTRSADHASPLPVMVGCIPTTIGPVMIAAAEYLLLMLHEAGT